MIATYFRGNDCFFSNCKAPYAHCRKHGKYREAQLNKSHSEFPPSRDVSSVDVSPYCVSVQPIVYTYF